MNALWTDRFDVNNLFHPFTSTRCTTVLINQARRPSERNAIDTDDYNYYYHYYNRI